MTELDISTLDAADEATLAIRHPTTGEATTWIWTFYGPAHPETVKLADRVSRDALRELAAQRAARINGRKWKEDDLSVDQLRADNVRNVIARTKGFTPVKIGADTIVFSKEAATDLLLDRRKNWLLDQVVTFLRDEENFIQPSGTN